jgi:hypothetical protein
MDNASQARFSGNHLLFMRDGDLMAVPFDPSNLALDGSPRQLKPNVVHAHHTDVTYTATAVGQYDVARDDVLVFASGDINENLPTHVSWFDRSGVSTPVDVEAGCYKSVRVAPDGASLLLWRKNPGDEGVWVLDQGRQSSRRELGGGSYLWFTWGPRAGQITGTRYVENGTELVTAHVGADSGQAAVLPFSKPILAAAEWSEDGQLLACAQTYDLWLCRTGGECRHVSRPDNVRERYPAVSPDGRWLAYSSDESSRWEVYIRSLSDLEVVHQVSFNGGTESAWSRDGSELFFVSQENMYVVAIGEGDDSRLSIGEPQLLFHVGVFYSTTPIRSWDVAPDGRFAFITPLSDEERTAMREKHRPDSIHIVQNWTAKLYQ